MKENRLPLKYGMETQTKRERQRKIWNEEIADAIRDAGRL